MKTLILQLSLVFLIFAGHAMADSTPKSANKLLYMYRVYYLPFGVDFREGRTKNDILPFRGMTAESSELLSADDLTALDRQWDTIRDGWKRRSLFLTTPVAVGGTMRVAPRLVSHKISLTRSALDTLAIPDRIQINDLLRTKAAEVQAEFKQLRFLKSFVDEKDEGKFNVFIFSASWCSSSREYRALLESYLKSSPQNDVVLHSVVIDDPDQKIFDAKILKELFPHQERYTHESIPKFIALENINGKSVVYEEGDALFALYERYLKPMRGFLNKQTILFRGQPTSRGLASEPSPSPLLRAGSLGK